MFGDDDPEDAWDDLDPRAVKLGILVRLLLSVALEHKDPTHDHARVRARIAIGIWHSTALDGHATPAEAPVLAALMTAFALLNALEGP